MRDKKRTTILLLTHNTPNALHEIPKYLRNVTNDQLLPQTAINEITHRYSLIDKNPLTNITMTQARLLKQHIKVPIYVNMQNGKPYIATVVRQIRNDEITTIATICLTPQNSRTNVGLYHRAMLDKAGHDLTVDFTES